MDNTYYYIFVKFYKHFFRFCTGGSLAAKEAVVNMEREVENAEDGNLNELYQIVLLIMNTDDEENKFYPRSEKYRLSLSKEDYVDSWCLYSILYLTYKYIHPNSEKLQESLKQKEIAAEELKKLKNFDYQLEYEDSDYAIRMHIDKKIIINDAYNMRFENRDFRLKNRSFMMILKGYSSSTPFFYPALKERFHNIPIKGGGIYIKWCGTGIVVDPGINYMENLHMVGLGIKDIDIIIVTHNHVDHNGDLMTIDDLASQIGKKDIVLYTDKDTESDIFKRLVNFASDKRHGWDLTMGLTINIGSKKDIQVEAIPTKHIMTDSQNSQKSKYLENITFAIKFSLKENGNTKVRIGYTSDTIYLNALSEAFWDCDYVIANISETDSKDYAGSKPKEKHLGYSGCLKLIRECLEKREHTARDRHIPKFIISEFWAGKGDVRKEIIKRLRQDASYQFIYPGDIGMMYFLEQPTFLCGYCGREKGLEKLHVVKSGVEYSSFYNICDECIL